MLRCREVGFIQRLYIISTAVRSGLSNGLLHWFCHGVVRLVSSNDYIYYFHGREGGFTRQFIIIIITTTLFNVESREVGYPTVYDGYMIRYIVGF